MLPLVEFFRFFGAAAPRGKRLKAVRAEAEPAVPECFPVPTGRQYLPGIKGVVGKKQKQKGSLAQNRK